MAAERHRRLRLLVCARRLSGLLLSCSARLSLDHFSPGLWFGPKPSIWTRVVLLRPGPFQDPARTLPGPFQDPARTLPGPCGLQTAEAAAEKLQNEEE
ncbi:uncharacterized protein V6R79_011065 [Siganus canaliculatus]